MLNSSITIALAGNPNCGKTTLFNALTGSNQFVGNWPGVTVEKKEGKLKGDKSVTVTDLPGIYSLSPYTPEEIVARNYLLNEKPDAILNIIDGTNLERNLYLTTQLLEVGIPVVCAINMMDVVRKNGDKLDIAKLEKNLGCKIVEISALKSEGVDKAIELAKQAAESQKAPAYHKYSSDVEDTLNQIAENINVPDNQKRYFAVKVFERDEKLPENIGNVSGVNELICKLENKLDDDSESIITTERYEAIADIISGCVSKKAGKKSWSDKIDSIVTNRILALPIFAVVMFIVYYVSVTTVGGFATDWANDGVFGDGWSFFGIEVPGIPVLVEKLLDSIGCADWLSSLILDGIVAGVGAVLGFVPQILILFIFLAFLESCGYMARVAFIMDRIFRKFGLSGKSFIPMLIGSGCGVPGIMASRTIENVRDRRMTIMTTTFVPCSAKLPVIALIAGALFNESPWVAPCAYFLGVFAIVISGIILKKTAPFEGEAAPFVMELPAYHMPTFGNVMRSMWERGWSFIKKAGTIILVSTIFIWFTSSFGWVDGSFSMLEATEMEYSILAKIGKAVCWLFIPLGFGDWRSAVATVTGLVAKENVVATFGILYGGLEEVEEAGNEIWAALASSMTAMAGISFLIFNLLCAPCFAAMGAIKREMNSAKWTAFAILYQCGFAYLISLIVYRLVGLAFGVSFSIWTVFAVAALVVLVYMLVRKPTQFKKTQSALNRGAA